MGDFRLVKNYMCTFKNCYDLNLLHVTDSLPRSG